MQLELLATQAHEYLLTMLPGGVSEEQLEGYLTSDDSLPNSLRKIFIRIIGSAQNYQSMPSVIKFWDRKEEVGELLHDYDCTYVKNLDPEELYQQLRERFGVSSPDSRRNSWRKWSKSIVDAASFVSEFKDVEDFNRFVGLFSYNVPTRMALPLLISEKISGIGFALACDFLKELGFEDYPKPDVHISDICEGLGLCERDQIKVFETLVKAAELGEVTPYQLDKALWLISSGNFYREGIKVPGQKRQFIEHMKGLM